jgi:hypothetical protein
MYFIQEQTKYVYLTTKANYKCVYLRFFIEDIDKVMIIFDKSVISFLYKTVKGFAWKTSYLLFATSIIGDILEWYLNTFGA